MQKEFFESIEENKLSVIASRPACGRLQMILSFLKEYGIKQNKKIFFYNFVDTSIWYTMNLISFLSGIEKEIVRKFYYPCEMFSKEKKDFDKEKLIHTIEKINNSSIFMEDFTYILEPDTDVVDYFFNSLTSLDFNYEFLVINSLDALIKKSKYTIDEILLRFYNFAKYEKTRILFISDVKRSGEEKERYTLTDICHYKRLKGYVSNFILSRRLESSVCEIEYEIANDEKKNTYTFSFDFYTNQLKGETKNE